ncbi:MAG: BatD family protein [Nitrospinaceae bacterium]
MVRKFHARAIDYLPGNFGLKVLLGAWTLLFIVWPVWAETPISVAATVDKTHLSLEDTLELSVWVNGTEQSPPPLLPDLPDFQVEPRGTASSIKIINGNRQASLTFNYTLTPKRAGHLILPPIRITLEGVVYETQPIALTVEETSAPLPDGKAPVFAESVISRTDPFLQEQIVLTYRLYRKVEVRNVQLDAPLDHFRKKSLGGPREYSKIINGVRYYISETSFALYPMREGPVEIPAATFHLDLVRRKENPPGWPTTPFGIPPSLDLDGFFSNSPFGGSSYLERKNMRTRPLSLTVKSLPRKGRPQSFSNLVGNFKLSVDLTKDQLELGETTTLKAVVSGIGNAADAILPPPKTDHPFKIYQDQPQFKETVTAQGLHEEKTFRFALVPSQPGKLNIQPLELTFFDPATERYITLREKVGGLVVRPAPTVDASAGSPPIPSGTRRSFASSSWEKEILPIHTLDEEFQDAGAWHKILPFWAISFIIPPLLYGIGCRAHRRLQRGPLDIASARSRQALRRAETRLNQLSANGGRDSKALGRELSLILREYIGDKLNLRGSALTPLELAEKLRDRQFDESGIAAARQFLDRCESLEYAPPGGVAVDPMLATIRRLLQKLETHS